MRALIVFARALLTAPLCIDYGRSRLRGITMVRAVTTILILICHLLPCPGQDQSVKAERLSDRLYEITGGRGARCGLVIGDDAVLLIDTKMDQASMQQYITAIKTITDKPIRYLVNTHADVDHTQGNQYVPWPVTIIAHQNCRNELFLPRRDGRPSQWNEPNMVRFAPAITFQDRMDIYLGSFKVELWYFGVGHTTGDIVVYVPAERIAFIGDQIFIGRIPLIHAYKGGNTFQQIKTLESMLARLDQAQRFCSGHAKPSDRQGIGDYIKSMRSRQAKVKELIDRGLPWEQVKVQFQQEEQPLIEIIWNELRTG